MDLKSYPCSCVSRVHDGEALDETKRSDNVRDEIGLHF